MNNLTAYKCLDCGHYSISKRDGIKCFKCGGHVIPAGKAIYKPKEFDVQISMKDTDIFERMVKLLFEMIYNEEISEPQKQKIKSCILDKERHRHIRTITCQNCQAVLADIDNRSERIHLKKENIKFNEDGVTRLQCRCGCKTEYKRWKH